MTKTKLLHKPPKPFCSSIKAKRKLRVYNIINSQARRGILAQQHKLPTTTIWRPSNISKQSDSNLYLRSNQDSDLSLLSRVHPLFTTSKPAHDNSCSYSIPIPHESFGDETEHKMTARKTKCISEARYSEVSWLLLLTCVGLRAIEKLKALLVRLALHSAQPHCREALQVLRPSFRDVHRPHHGVCEPNRTEPKLLLRSLFLSLSHSLCVSVSLSRSLCEAESQRASPLAKKLGLQMWRNAVLLLSSCDGGPSLAPSRGISTPLILCLPFPRNLL